MCICVCVCVCVFTGNPFGATMIITDRDDHTFDLPGMQRGLREPDGMSQLFLMDHFFFIEMSKILQVFLDLSADKLINWLLCSHYLSAKHSESGPNVPFLQRHLSARFWFRSKPSWVVSGWLPDSVLMSSVSLWVVHKHLTSSAPYCRVSACLPYPGPSNHMNSSTWIQQLLFLTWIQQLLFLANSGVLIPAQPQAFFELSSCGSHQPICRDRLKKGHREMQWWDLGVSGGGNKLFFSWLSNLWLWPVVGPNFISSPKILWTIVHSYNFYLSWSECVSATHKHRAQTQGKCLSQRHCSCVHRPLACLWIPQHNPSPPFRLLFCYFMYVITTYRVFFFLMQLTYQISVPVMFGL